MTKVTVYLDDEVWGIFKAQVFQKHGNLRKLSFEVENLIKTAIIGDQIVSTFEKLGVTVNGTASSQEIKDRRPKLRGPPSEEILRETRHKRVAQILS